MSDEYFDACRKVYALEYAIEQVRVINDTLSSAQVYDPKIEKLLREVEGAARLARDEAYRATKRIIRDMKQYN